MPRAFSDNERDRIRAQLRLKAGHLFATRGLRKTSVGEIAQSAGISKGAFYLFFDSKEALCLEVLETIEAEMRARVLELALTRKRNARAQVAEILNAFLTTWDAYPLLRTFSQADFEYLVRKLPSERVAAHVAQDDAFIDTFAQKLKHEGIVLKVRPRVVASLIRALFWVGLHRHDLGEDDFAETMPVLTDLVAGYVTGRRR